MILGVGVDLIHVERIRRSIVGLGQPWLEYLFTVRERSLAEDANDPVQAYARGYCAKEACAKALGTGFNEEVQWQDIEVLQGAHDTIHLDGGAAKQLSLLCGKSHRGVFAASTMCTRTIAHAIVVLEALTL